ncbi:hypothetical protein NDU88_006321 [Pleurodeles waltl]|uniref:CCT domain-containing protein n=1 Tax=Pleurodeles waltl TaxID=8319 RepID=A0AAV7NQE6_PLEWA|nr:hypothetical protein NDU88_006321 [Pleurodeles waltl]
MGAGPAPSPPADRAPSAHGRFIQCTAACSLLSRDESALQCASLASAEDAGGTTSLRESPVSVTAASPVAPVPAGPPRSGIRLPLVPLDPWCLQDKFRELSRSGHARDRRIHEAWKKSKKDRRKRRMWHAVNRKGTDPTAGNCRRKY